MRTRLQCWPVLFFKPARLQAPSSCESSHGRAIWATKSTPVKSKAFQRWNWFNIRDGFSSNDGSQEQNVVVDNLFFLKHATLNYICNAFLMHLCRNHMNVCVVYHWLCCVICACTSPLIESTDRWTLSVVCTLYHVMACPVLRRFTNREFKTSLCFFGLLCLYF